MTSAGQYDVVIIGSGAGGGTLAYHLANAGKRVLILERGSFLPQEKPNWDTTAVFLDNRYHTKDVWTDKDGKPLHPGTGYWVGGNTKVYGAALFRLREQDFGVLHHKGRAAAPHTRFLRSRTSPACSRFRMIWREWDLSRFLVLSD
jgi:choline dehydrogenase-like flavoprotein